jgi:hypothetical protein
MITIDHSMTWIIWPLLIFGLMAIRGGRRGRHRAPWDWGWGWHSQQQQSFDSEPLMKELEVQRVQMEEMATRLAELENRADFTERMLATPRGDSFKATPS